MLKNYYSNIINTGINNENSSTRNKRIQLLNTYAVIWIHLATLFPLADIIFNDEFGTKYIYSWLAQLITIISLIIVVLLNKLNFFKTARLLWLSIAFINFLSFSIFILPGEYMEYYYIIIPGIALSLYTNNIIPWITFVVSFILFLTPYFFVDIYPKDYGERMEIPAMLGVFLSMFFLVKYFKKNNLKNEEQLVLTYQKLEENQKSELAHLQLKSLKAQMNPHFVFNAMNSIQNLIIKGDKQEAYNYLTKFSLMLRENLDMSEKSFVFFNEELSLLKKYLELEKLRFKNNFNYKLFVPEEMDIIKVPSMIIQPFIENSIKHGLLHKINGIKELKIVFKINNEVLFCTIIDNGIGMQESKRINESNENKPDSFSTNAIRQRLKFLKDYYKTDIGFKYLPVEEGTKVEITIPYTEG